MLCRGVLAYITQKSMLFSSSQPSEKPQQKYTKTLQHSIETIFKLLKGGDELMGRMKKVDSSYSEVPTPLIRPAQTEEERLNHCIAMAYDVVEERLANRSASAQEVCHFLKLATEQTKLETEKLKNENTLTLAKVDALRAQEQQAVDYAKVIEALTSYGAHNNAY